MYFRLFTNRSFPQLHRILEEYSKLTGKNLKDQLEEYDELENDFKECLLALIECSIDTPAFFARLLNKYLEYTYGISFLNMTFKLKKLS